MLLGLAAAPAYGVSPVFVDAAGVCGGNTPCFTTIQEGVNNATEPMAGSAVVFVFPGTYPESVDLSDMGSAVGGSPGDIVLVTANFLEPLSLPLASPTSFGSIGSSSLAAANAELAAAALEIADMFDAAARALGQPEGAAAGLPASELVFVRPAAGPAVFNSVTPFPGSVGIGGFDVKSLDDDGIRITSNDSAVAQGVRANENAQSGIILDVAEAMLFFTRTDDNGRFGTWVNADDGAISAFNPSGSGNGSTGIRLGSAENVGLVGFAVDTSDTTAALFTATTANDNGGAGIAISAEGSGVVIFTSSIVGTEAINANDNDESGVFFNVGEDATAIGVIANRNNIGIQASALDGGITISDSMASDNDVHGMDLSAGGSTDFDLFGTLGVLLLTVRADGNDASGIAVSTVLPIFMNDSTAIGNLIDGLTLTNVPAGSNNRVQGNILCANGAAGLRLVANASVDATGNWWGSATGPFHASKNPGGQGNPVVDGTSGGGMGDVDFIPFIDTVTASATGPFVVGGPIIVRFQFSGGDGTVFLGPTIPELVGSEPPFAGPFTVTTDNGVLTDLENYVSAPTIQQFINEFPGIVAVRLLPAHPGSATVTIEGPCGPSGSITLEIGRLAAPTMSAVGLGTLVAALSLLGTFVLRAKTPRDAKTPRER